MEIQSHSAWGEIYGKLALTPEQAMEEFGFKMREGAIGIYFMRKNGKVYICNAMRKRTMDKNALAHRKMHAKLVKVGSQCYRLIREAWEPLAKGKKYSGWNLFVSTNSRRLWKVWKSKATKFRWSKLVVTQGTLPRPSFWVKYEDKGIRVGIRNYNEKEVGIVLLNLGTHKLCEIPAKRYKQSETILIEEKMYKPLVYMYFKQEKNYSESKCIYWEEKEREDSIKLNLRWRNTTAHPGDI